MTEHQFAISFDGEEIVAICQGYDGTRLIPRNCWWQREFDSQTISGEDIDFARLEFDMHHGDAA